MAWSTLRLTSSSGRPRLDGPYATSSSTVWPNIWSSGFCRTTDTLDLRFLRTFFLCLICSPSKTMLPELGLNTPLKW